jgi:hypothetical protein
MFVPMTVGELGDNRCRRTENARLPLLTVVLYWQKYQNAGLRLPWKCNRQYLVIITITRSAMKWISAMRTAAILTQNVIRSVDKAGVARMKPHMHASVRKEGPAYELRINKIQGHLS